MRHIITPKLHRTWWKQLGITLGWIGVAFVLGAMMHLFLPAHAFAADQGYFNCLRYGMTYAQKKEVADWFGSDGVKSCCDLSDGMPGFAEDRADGIYVAPREVTLPLAEACRDHPDQPLRDPPDDHSAWVREDIGRVLHKNNPIGVVVVWWTEKWTRDGTRRVWEPRCVANLVRI